MVIPDDEVNLTDQRPWQAEGEKGLCPQTPRCVL